jgi:hypothetical protein
VLRCLGDEPRTPEIQLPDLSTVDRTDVNGATCQYSVKQIVAELGRPNACRPRTVARPALQATGIVDPTFFRWSRVRRGENRGHDGPCAVGQLSCA